MPTNNRSRRRRRSTRTRRRRSSSRRRHSSYYSRPRPRYIDDDDDDVYTDDERYGGRRSGRYLYDDVVDDYFVEERDPLAFTRHVAMTNALHRHLAPVKLGKASDIAAPYPSLVVHPIAPVNTLFGTAPGAVYSMPLKRSAITTVAPAVSVFSSYIW